jgi:hypothetical protein
VPRHEEFGVVSPREAGKGIDGFPVGGGGPAQVPLGTQGVSQQAEESIVIRLALKGLVQGGDGFVPFTFAVQGSRQVVVVAPVRLIAFKAAAQFT